MKFTAVFKAAALTVAALAIGGASPGNWNTTVTQTNGGHRIGNPDAKVKLVEFISYTCPHCAKFTRESDGPLKVGYIAPGDVSVEVRHLIRDPVDLTAAVLANCGTADKFAQNHAAFMFGQEQWIAPLARVTQAQRQRWTNNSAGRRAIASDFGFYKLMEERGYRRSEVDRCLADDDAAQTLAENSAEDWKRPGISGTPSFAINGVVLPGTHAWTPLERQIKEFL